MWKSQHIWASALTALLNLSMVKADIHVSPTGSDTASGSLESPIQSIQLAVDNATPGSTIFLRGGTYSPTTNIQISKSGTSSEPYILRAYEGESVVLDGEALTGFAHPYPWIPCFGCITWY